MSDISFLVFEDERGFYRLEGDGPIKDRTRMDMSKEEAYAWIEAHQPEIPYDEEEPESDMNPLEGIDGFHNQIGGYSCENCQDQGCHMCLDASQLQD